MVQPGPQGEVIAGVDTDEGQLFIEVRDEHCTVRFDDDGRVHRISILSENKKNIILMSIHVLEDHTKFFNMCTVYEIILSFYIYLQIFSLQ